MKVEIIQTALKIKSIYHIYDFSLGGKLVKIIYDASTKTKRAKHFWDVNQ